MFKKHVKACLAAAAAALGLLAAGGAAAQARLVPLLSDLAPVAGSSFDLWWIDESFPAAGLSSVTDGDIWLAYDPAVLSLSGVSVGSIFNGAQVKVLNEAYLRGQYDYLDGLAVHGFQLFGGAANSGTTTQDVAIFSFNVLLQAPSGETSIYLLPDQVAVDFANTYGVPTGYYAFGSSIGYAVGVPVTAVPEPAGAALLLAGLLVVAGVGAQRRRTQDEPTTSGA